MTAGPSPLWYATRATGVMALVLLTATVILGVAGVARFATPRWPRVITAGMHRNLSLLAVAFVAGHVLTTVLDTYTPIGWVSAVVPFSSAYRTFWLGLGAIAFDLLLAVVVTSLLRVRLGYRAWRSVHWLGYAAWPVALWHGLGTGTDSRLPWLLALDAACVAAVVCALGWRLWVAGTRPGWLTSAAICASVPVATAAFVAIGPLQPGWARRAGTPVTLLAGAAAAPAAAAPGAAAPAGAAPGAAGAAPTAPAPASGPFAGRAVRTKGTSGALTITVTARTTTAAAQHLVITLRGAPDGTGITLSSGTVSIGRGGAGPGYSGPVARLAGNRLLAELHGPGGSTARARITLVIRGAAATGRLSIAAEAAR
jgi:sulfoxide reductase heme-binding subunit YedZ